MEKIRIEKLTPGMVLGRSVYLPDGRILVRENTPISPMIISKLKELRLPALFVKSGNEDGNSQTLVSDAARSDLTQALYKLDSNFRAGKAAGFSSCRIPLHNLVDEIVFNQRMSLDAADIRFQNDQIYGHMVNVCIVAVKIGLEMGYNQLKLAELAYGVIFHDIGMVKIPVDILNRIGGLTNEETRLIQTHPKTGYELLRQSPDVSAASAHVAYEHHERFNGSGYPRGLVGEAIHEYARITAVADVYDAMCTEKIYRPAKTVPEIVDYLQNESGNAFDPNVVEIFTKVIAH